MKPTTQYRSLKPGDVRQKGDECRRYVEGGDHLDEYRNAHWLPVRLLGHAILPVDFKACEFRRPV